MNWFNAGWLLLDLAIIAVLIPTVILQRRESGATLAWILVIVLLLSLPLLRGKRGYSSEPAGYFPAPTAR